MSLTQLTDLQPTNIKVTGIATFDQTVGIAGTLTYEDVTNVDSVGILTARSTIDAQGSINLADSIIHTGDTNTKIRFPAADTITAETGGSERVRISSGGSIGIGTDNPQQDVHILRSQLSRVRIESTSTSYNSDVIFQNPDGLMGVVGYNATLDSINIDSRGGTNGVTFTRTGVEKVRIASNGNVGIGTDNPQKLLEIQHVGNRKLQFSYDDNIITIKGCNNNSNPETIRLIGGNSIRFHTGATGSGDERLRIDNAGKIGVGQAPNTKFNVKLGAFAATGDDDASDWGADGIFQLDHSGTAAANNEVLLLGAVSGAVGQIASGFGFGRESTSNWGTYLSFKTHSTSTSNIDELKERVRIKSDGTVVFNNTINTIHTNSNDSKLVLFGGSNNSVSNGGVLSLHGITHSGGNYTDLSAGAGGYIQFRSGTSEKFRITAGGEVLCGLTTTGTDPTRNITLHAGTMMRVSNFYMGRVHQSSNNGNAAIVLHKLGQNQGFQMSGSMTFHSYTGSAYLSGCIVCRYNNDDVTRDVSLQKANSGMNLQLVEGTISGVSGTYLAIKKNGGGTGVCYINGFFGGNIEAYGGIREIASGDWTTTTVHGSGITGSNDSSSS